MQPPALHPPLETFADLIITGTIVVHLPDHRGARRDSLHPRVQPGGRAFCEGKLTLLRRHSQLAGHFDFDPMWSSSDPALAPGENAKNTFEPHPTITFFPTAKPRPNP